MQKQPPIFFELSISTLLILYLLFIHFFVLICIWLSFGFWGFWGFWFGILLCSISFLFFLNREIQFYKKYDHFRLEFLSDQTWKIYFSTNQVEFAELLESSVKTYFYCMLNFNLLNSNKKRTILVLRDSVQKDYFKVLKRCVQMSRIFQKERKLQ
ncbi:MAG: hypothetical protein ACD_29C00450G0005 [uncultured bacterium]|nr:MAG: hypothetical protein ACD_29C00450G0005 [uncultured bacterium]